MLETYLVINNITICTFKTKQANQYTTDPRNEIIYNSRLYSELIF